MVSEVIRRLFGSRKPPYGHEAIAGQLGYIAEMTRMRDKAAGSEERERLQEAIYIAQEVLVYMLEKDKQWQKRGNM